MLSFATSTIRSFSSFVPAMHPYRTNQSCCLGSQRPPTALACSCKDFSVTPILKGTSVLSGYLAGGGVHSHSLTIISTVFTCRRVSHHSDNERKSVRHNIAPATSLFLFAPALDLPAFSCITPAYMKADEPLPWICSIYSMYSNQMKIFIDEFQLRWQGYHMITFSTEASSTYKRNQHWTAKDSKGQNWKGAKMNIEELGNILVRQFGYIECWGQVCWNPRTRNVWTLSSAKWGCVSIASLFFRYNMKRFGLMPVTALTCLLKIWSSLKTRQ